MPSDEERGRQGLRDASQPRLVRGVRSRGRVIKNDTVAELQVVLKVGFRVESSKAAD